jgi:SAM-dependent methyltransferase
MGSHKLQQNFVVNHVRPFTGMRILDIGCGPAEILNYLPDVDYVGFDISNNYIKNAKSKFGSRGKFYCKQIKMEDVDKLPPFDVVLFLGFIHHLDDDIATDIMRISIKSLKTKGRLLTVDPCFEDGQNPIAKFLISNDRGMNVRNADGYKCLAKKIFKNPVVKIRHRSWIPYTDCFMECTK